MMASTIPKTRASWLQLAQMAAPFAAGLTGFVLLMIAIPWLAASEYDVPKAAAGVLFMFVGWGIHSEARTDCDEPVFRSRKNR